MIYGADWQAERYGTYIRKVGPGTFQRYNHQLGILTTMEIEHLPGGGKKVHVNQQQRVDDILDLNVYQQNHCDAPKEGLRQATRIPVIEHRKIMKQCGLDEKKPQDGYDEKKFRQIVNDRDFYKFKTVSGRI